MTIINWFEIPVRDLDRASAVYTALYEVPLEHEEFEGVRQAKLTRPGHAGAFGALVADPARPPAPGQSTVIYLDAVGGLDGCLARAVAAGATVVQPRTAIGPQGYIALFADLDGNVIGLHEARQA